jgi:hypothetical protein
MGRPAQPCSLFGKSPLARSLKRRSIPDIGIEHVTPVIGYHNDASSPLVGGFNHLAKKPAVYSIVVEPLLTYRKANSSSEAVHTTSDDRDGAINRRNGLTTFLDCKIVPHFRP